MLTKVEMYTNPDELNIASEVAEQLKRRAHYRVWHIIEDQVKRELEDISWRRREIGSWWVIWDKLRRGIDAN